MMRIFAQLSILFLLTVTVYAITLQSGVSFQGATILYNLSGEFPGIGDIVLYSDTLSFGGKHNWTFWTDNGTATIEFDHYSSTWQNFTVTPSENTYMIFNITGMNATDYYSVFTSNGSWLNTSQADADGSVSLYSDDFDSDVLFTINTTVTTTTTTTTSTTLIGYYPTTYELYNGSTYVSGENQTFPWYCFPLHDGCVPRYETSTQHLINYSYTDNTSRRVALSINSTHNQVEVYANTEFNYTTATQLGASGTLINSSLENNTNLKLWFWLNVTYLFDDYPFELIMEVK